MGEFSVVLAIILGSLIIFYELLREKRAKPIDFLTGVNVLFFMSFVIPPISLFLFNVEFSSWTNVVNVESLSSIIAIFYSIIGYLTLLIGYNFANKLNIITRIPTDFVSSDIKIRRFAHILGFVGILFFLTFIYFIGGFNNLFLINTQLRSGMIEDVPFAFLRNITLFIPIASQIFYVLYKFHKKNIFSKDYMFFVFYLLVSIIIYFNRATRMGLLLFLISFIIINALFYKKSLKRYFPIMGALLILFVFYGKRFFNYFVLEEFNFENIEISLYTFIDQFSFPFFTLTNAIENNLYNGVPRLFIDFILGIINLLPSAIVPMEIPKTITQVNSEFFMNGVPVDIISLGFFSFGISGVVITLFIFGLTLNCLENVLQDKENILVVVFYTQFLFYFALLIPYAGPTNVIKSNFCLLIAFIAFVLLFDARQKKNTKELQRVGYEND